MEDIYRSQFRLPYSLYEQLKKAADTNHRSVNAELIARLEASFAELEHPSLTTRIRREALSGEEPVQAASPEAKHELTDEQLWDVITEVLDSVTGRERRPPRPSKGPQPRGKPKK